MEDNEREILVSRPQFDTNVLTPGCVVRFTSENYVAVRNSYARNCLITKATPIELRLAFVNDEDDIDEVRVTSEQVSSGEVKIMLRAGRA